MTDETESRVNRLERDTAVHEAVCAERYRGITVRLNVVMAALGMILTAIAAGDPLVGFLRALVVR